MEFSKVIGNINPSLVTQAQDLLSAIFLELGTKYDNVYVGTGYGGDPLIFTLLYPVEHVCTMNIPTAATDGKRYYWNPKFVLKFANKLKRRGLRMVCAHEAWHAIYMHPSRRGSRLPKLWNIAVDYIVNGAIMDDLKARKLDPKVEFSTYLGNFKTLEEYAEMLKDPFKHVKDIPEKEEMIPLPAPGEDRELTEDEKKELDRREKRSKDTFFFADPNLSEEMQSPEKIYDYLYSLLPKCPKCGSVGLYSKPNKNKKDKGDKNKDKGDKGDKGDKSKGKGDKNEDNGDHQHGDGDPCNCGGEEGEGCDHCGGGIDVFDLGGTVDDHMDTSESEEKIAKRLSDAIESTRRMAGHVPSQLVDELGLLTAPKVTWKDIIRTRLLKARAGNGRNDWTKFKTRPMFAGLLVPRKRNYFAKFGCLLDTSGSMSKDDMAFGLSQLCSLDDKSEGVVVPADADIYWDEATLLKKANKEEISKVKVVGRGGTMYASFFSDYEKHLGKCDFLIVISDGYLMDTDVAAMQHPGIDVIWLLTSSSGFKPPFGRVFDLRSI
jgi:predicted metal-dependent peptidase